MPCTATAPIETHLDTSAETEAADDTALIAACAEVEKARAECERLRKIDEDHPDLEEATDRTLSLEAVVSQTLARTLAGRRAKAALALSQDYKGLTELLESVALDALAPELPPATDISLAMAERDQLCAEYERTEAAHSEALQASLAAAPFPASLIKNAGSRVFPELRWVTEAQVMADSDLSTDEKFARVADLRAWTAARDEAFQDLNVGGLEDASDEVFERAMDINYEILRTPAETPLELAYKLLVYLGWTARRIGDPPEELISEMMSQEDSDSQVVAELMQECLRLTGRRHSTAGVFEAEACVAEFERLPGCIVTDFGPSYVGRDGPNQETVKTAGAMWRALPLWRRKLVKAAVAARYEQIKAAAEDGVDALLSYIAAASGSVTLIDGNLYLGRPMEGADEYMLRGVEEHLSLFDNHKKALVEHLTGKMEAAQ